MTEDGGAKSMMAAAKSAAGVSLTVIRTGLLLCQ